MPSLGRDGMHVYVHAQLLHSCPTLCDPMDCSPPGSSVHGNLQARRLAWVAMPFSRGSSQPWNWTCISALAGGFFTHWATWEALAMGQDDRKKYMWKGMVGWREELKISQGWRKVSMTGESQQEEPGKFLPGKRALETMARSLSFHGRTWRVFSRRVTIISVTCG